MKVEIWSDVICPFCYIGKRRFEQALEEFEYSDRVDIEWRSYLLNPNIKTDPEANINEYLANTKGWTIEKAAQMNERVTNMANEAGLTFDMDNIVVANSFNAHRIIQFAKSQGKGSEVEESLFKAYFTEGKNIDDAETLIEIAESVSLDAAGTQEVLEGDQFSNVVKHDMQTARGMNIQGVPFFLFNRKFVISGAQSSDNFLNALKQTWNNWLKQQKEKESAEIDGVICGPNGECQ